MTVSALSGPAINFGVTLSSSGAPGDYNEERGPSLNDLGEGTIDPRSPFCYKPGNAVGSKVFGWAGCFGGPVVDFMPITLSSIGLSSGFSSTGAVAAQVTLATTATSSSFRLISAFQPSTYPSNTTVSVVMLDGYQQGVAVGQGATSPNYTAGQGFGTGNTVQLWNPLVMGGRCLAFGTTSNNDTGTTYVVKGFDVYGYAMSCTVAGASSGTANITPKAFKYVLSSGITFTGNSSGSANVVIGTADTYGFPLFVNGLSYAQVMVGGSSVQSIATTAANHTFGYGSSAQPITMFGSTLSVTSSWVALSSGGDVRGTYASSVASNATFLSSFSATRITMTISPTVNNLGAGISYNNFFGLLGLPQV